MYLLNIVLLNIVISQQDLVYTLAMHRGRGRLACWMPPTLQSPGTSTSIIMWRTSKPYEKLLRWIAEARYTVWVMPCGVSAVSTEPCFAHMYAFTGSTRDNCCPLAHTVAIRYSNTIYSSPLIMTPVWLDHFSSSPRPTSILHWAPFKGLLVEWDCLHTLVW